MTGWGKEGLRKGHVKLVEQLYQTPHLPTLLRAWYARVHPIYIHTYVYDCILVIIFADATWCLS